MHDAHASERADLAGETFRVGIDVGGTFTDLVLWAGAGDVETFKVLTTPQDPSLGVLDGLAVMAQSKGLSPREFAARTRLIVHGTTVTTNAVLTRGGACTGLITTRGVRDALEMRRGVREEQYDNRYPNVVPLVPRRRRLTVGGRLDSEGRQIAPLAREDVRSAAESLKAQGVEAVAICFLHAYANPDHERAAAEIVREVMPRAFLSVSSDVLPTIRFYDRVSTTALDGYVGPVLDRYLESLTTKLAAAGFAGVLLVMQSNGGVARAEVTRRQPAMTLLSGPAAGPRAAAAYARVHGRDDCILFDMGGTSFDASLVRGGDAAMDTAGEIDRLRIALPMLAITTIGAGGGSIGWIDDGGLLRMGPKSAGALPGPACYGRGGELPTCTDADLVLGYLDPRYFAGGKLVLDVERARAAISERIAAPLGLGLEEAAAGMYRVINSNMAHGVREITVERGLDPREFPLVVAGGAGALHACMIAHELDAPTLIVPPTASTLCAMGMLFCDLQQDHVRSCVGPLEKLERARLLALAAELMAAGKRELVAQGGVEIVHALALDLRYLKQYHEVTLPVPIAALERGDVAGIARAFHAEHDRLYGYELAAEGTGLELINVRVRSIARTEKPPLRRVARGGRDAAHALKGRRRAFVPEDGAFAEVPVYDAHRLLCGNAVAGPALLERTDTTVLVTASYAAEVDERGGIRIERRGGREPS